MTSGAKLLIHGQLLPLDVKRKQKKGTFKQQDVWAMQKGSIKIHRGDSSLSWEQCGTLEESSGSVVPPSDQMQSGTAMTLTLQGLWEKSDAAQLMATETWQNLSVSKIKSEGVGVGWVGGGTEIEVWFQYFVLIFLLFFGASETGFRWACMSLSGCRTLL